MNQPPTLRLTIESRIENVRLAGLALHKICEDLGMDPQDCYNVELCAVETLTNVVRHAYDGVPGLPIEIVARTHGDRIEIEISDQGRPFPARLQAPDPPELDPSDIESIPEGGYGIFLIYELMDVVEFRRREGRNVATLKKLRTRSGSG